MKRALVSVICALTLAGCAGQFNVRQADDRFSENKNPVFISENNRISAKSVAGGLHIDAKGVYINPFVEKNKNTNQIVALGFRITNQTDYNTMSGAQNQLGSISEIVFRLNGGQLITLPVVKAEEKADGPVTYNSVGGFASYAKQESGIVLISKEQFEKLITSSTISCRIAGSKRNAVFEEGDISGSFLENLRQFYQGYVK